MDIYTLENDFIRLSLNPLGAGIYKVEIKPLANRNVVLTAKNLEDYASADNGYLGATVGRVAGRIGGAKFKIDRKAYQLEQNDHETNSLHGGFASFAFKRFSVRQESSDEIRFTYKSIDGEGGYPGELVLNVIYKISEDGFSVDYFATTTKKTIINITNHSYFNLDGSATITNHYLSANAQATYTHSDKQLNEERVIITGDHPFAIRKAKLLGEIIHDPRVNVPPACGLDYLCEISGPLTLKGRDLVLEVTSNYPAVQLYSTNFPAKCLLLNGEHVEKYHALAIEPVDIVKSVGEEYPQLEVEPDELYTRYINYKFKVI